MTEATSYRLDIIVLTHGHMELSIRCVKALYKHTSIPFHLIVMDDSTPDMNDGTDMTPEWFTRFAAAHDNCTLVHSDEPYGTSLHLFEMAFPYCKTPYVTVVVNSMVVEPEWELAALQVMETNSAIGMIGLKCLRMGTELIESAGLAYTIDNTQLADMGRGLSSHRLSKLYECDAVQWAFVLLRLEAVKDNLGADIYWGFKGMEEFETCYTMRQKGWKIYFCGLGVGYHQTLATRIATSDDDIIKNLQNKELFSKRWGFWSDYHKMHRQLGEYYPKKVERSNLKLSPVVKIDLMGLTHRAKTQTEFQTVEARDANSGR